MVMMPAAIPMVMMVMISVRADAAHMMMVAGLGGAHLVGVAEDPRAVLAELAVHCRIAGADLLDALGEGVEDARMVAQIGRLDELDLGMARCHRVGFAVDPLDEDAGEEEVGEDDDSREAQP